MSNEPSTIDFSKFTDRAKKVFALGNQEAHRDNQEWFGPEHILLGLVKEGDGVAGNVLKNYEIGLRQVRAAVEKFIPSPPEPVLVSKLPYRSETHLVVQYADEFMRQLIHHHIGTEHLLLGITHLVDEQPALIIARVFAHLKIIAAEIREETLNLLGATLPDGKRPDMNVISRMLQMRKELRHSTISYGFTIDEFTKFISRILNADATLTSEDLDKAQEIIDEKKKLGD